MVRPRESRLPKAARDFRALLDQAKLTRADAAELVSKSERTVRGYADGSRVIPDLVTRSIETYIRYEINRKAKATK